MMYVRFHIGEHKIPMLVDPKNSDVALLYARGDEIGPHVVKLPESNEMAETLGRLIFRGPRYKLPVDPDLVETLMKRVDDLVLSVRSQNCLQNMGIEYVWQLVEMSSKDLLSIRDFGKKSLREIIEILDEMNLSLDMKIDEDIKRLIPKPHGST